MCVLGLGHSLNQEIRLVERNMMVFSKNIFRTLIINQNSVWALIPIVMPIINRNHTHKDRYLQDLANCLLPHVVAISVYREKFTNYKFLSLSKVF